MFYTVIILDTMRHLPCLCWMIRHLGWSAPLPKKGRSGAWYRQCYCLTAKTPIVLHLGQTTNQPTKHITYTLLTLTIDKMTRRIHTSPPARLLHPINQRPSPLRQYKLSKFWQTTWTPNRPIVWWTCAVQKTFKYKIKQKQPCRTTEVGKLRE